MDNTPAEPAAKSPPPLPAITGEIPQGIELINYVAECLALGCDPEDIRKQLLAFGHTPANAEKLVADTIAWREKNPDAGKANDSSANAPGYNGHMIIGILAVIIGVGVTGVTYFAASTGAGSGRYIVAWGAILFGIVEILRGFGSATPPKR